MTDSNAYPAPTGQPADGAAPTTAAGSASAAPAAAIDLHGPRKRGRRWVLPTILLAVGLAVGGTAGGVTGYVLHGSAGGGPSSSQFSGAAPDGASGTAPDGTSATPPAMPNSDSSAS